MLFHGEVGLAGIGMSLGNFSSLRFLRAAALTCLELVILAPELCENGSLLLPTSPSDRRDDLFPCPSPYELLWGPPLSHRRRLRWIRECEAALRRCCF